MTAEENLRLAALLFPETTGTIAGYEAAYPPRSLPDGAEVTRFAPSPTGFVHIGSLLPSLVSERIARQTRGVFYLRIEDTDRKREIANGVAGIVRSLAMFGIVPDEGPVGEGFREVGAYGPYRQRRRKAVYHSVARRLVEAGLAYPCFCTEEDNRAMRARQESLKEDPGYYGTWAIHRHASYDDIVTLLRDGAPWVLRLRAPDRSDRRIRYEDMVKGMVELPENFQDIILLKSDGLPTYHFAHLADDRLMRTTLVIRGDEWLSSVPIHLQLFMYMGWSSPRYAHIAPLMKMEGSTRRKLAKRKDPEAAVLYFHEQGYPAGAVQDYLLNLVNSNFEDWRRQHPEEDNRTFSINLSRMGSGGPLFDLVKLRDVSSNTIARMDTGEVYRQATAWAAEYDPPLHRLLTEEDDKALAILAIERGGPKPRKDIAMWSEVRHYLRYFYDSLFDLEAELSEHDSLAGCRIPPVERSPVLQACMALYDERDDRTAWFSKIKAVSERFGYTADMKAYRKDPSPWKGAVADVCTLIRVALTGRLMTPDLWSILQVLGSDRSRHRAEAFLSLYS